MRALARPAEADPADRGDEQQSRRSRAPSRTRLAGTFLLTLVPGALTVFLSFHGGGFFAGTTGLVAAALAVLLIVRVTVAGSPFDGLDVAGSVAAAGLGLLAVWTLVSSYWSDAAGRALLSFDRTLLYVFAILLVGSVAWLPRSVRAMLRAFTLGIVVVGAVGLITRVLPDVWHVAPDLRNERLSYPITYWNALGILVAIGIVLCVHLTCDSAEPRWVRSLSAAGVPVLAATLLFTYSRGAIAACVIGVVLYLAIARPRGAIAGLLVALPAGAVGAVGAYRADLLAKPDFATSQAAVDQGHRVAAAVAVSAVLAALLRLLLTKLDDRFERVEFPRSARLVGIGAAVAIPAVAVGVAIALGAPHALSRQFDNFVHGDTVRSEGDVRTRLASAGNNGRLDTWQVALKAFRRSPANGSGGGTYQLDWQKDRELGFTAVNAHSLYLETLGELGVVGLVLLLLALGALILRVAMRARGRERALHAAVLAALVMWAVHAGIDWDWSMPAVSVGVLGLAAAAVAAPRMSPGTRWRRRMGPIPRLWLAAGLVVLAVPPALVAVSQQRLDSSVRAFQRGDCRGAIDAALGSLSALSIRPEPFEVLGYCDAELGQTRLATKAMRSASDRDPRNWEFHYGLAIVRGAAGLDPRPAVGRALQRNPREPIVLAAAKALHTSNPRLWKRAARQLPLTIPAGGPARAPARR